MLRRLTGMVAAAVVTAVATVGVGVGAATAAATAERVAAPPLPPLDRPLSDARTHRPLACPDPSVTRAPRGRFTYLLYCTSDQAPDGFGIYGSSDLRDWTRVGSVFPRGHQPAWALPAGVRHSPGRFWGPSINFIGGRWVLYFSAEYDPASHAAPKRLSAGTMVLGAATARSPLGPWRATLLHYPGELDASSPRADRERHGGGDIDPAAVLDPVTGQRLLVWSQQHDRIWLGGLSRDGLTLGPTAQLAFSHTPAEPWECDPPTRSTTAIRGCTVEGPEPLFHDGRMFVLYSGADTWDATYAVGVASAPAPFSPFTKDPHPILRSGHGILGPGGVSNPIVAPDGRTVVLYHALTRPDPRHRSDQRQLMVGTLGWTRGGRPIIDDGTP